MRLVVLSHLCLLVCPGAGVVSTQQSTARHGQSGAIWWGRNGCSLETRPFTIAVLLFFAFCSSKPRGRPWTTVERQTARAKQTGVEVSCPNHAGETLVSSSFWNHASGTEEYQMEKFKSNQVYWWILNIHTHWRDNASCRMAHWRILNSFQPWPMAMGETEH